MQQNIPYEIIVEIIRYIPDIDVRRFFGIYGKINMEKYETLLQKIYANDTIFYPSFIRQVFPAFFYNPENHSIEHHPNVVMYNIQMYRLRRNNNPLTHSQIAYEQMLHSHLHEHAHIHMHMHIHEQLLIQNQPDHNHDHTHDHNHNQGMQNYGWNYLRYDRNRSNQSI